MENAFGILVSRFRVMRTTIELPPETVREVVMTCVVLHNILKVNLLVSSLGRMMMMMCLAIVD